MKDFNLITDNLYHCRSHGTLYIIGKRGNLSDKKDKKEYWDDGKNTTAEVLIYDSHQDTIAWKNVKFSSKGHFINTGNKYGRVYLDKFGFPSDEKQ